MGGFLSCALVLTAVESVVSKRTENLAVAVRTNISLHSLDRRGERVTNQGVLGLRELL